MILHDNDFLGLGFRVVGHLDHFILIDQLLVGRLAAVCTMVVVAYQHHLLRLLCLLLLLLLLVVGVGRYHLCHGGILLQ